MNRSALWYFEHFGLLEGLSDEQKEEVERTTRMIQLKRGEAVYLPGDPSEHLYVVKSGAVKILGRSPEGTEVILSVLIPGDLFGELALAGGERREDRAEASDDSLLCEVPRDVLIRMIQEAPPFSLHVAKIFGRRLRTLSLRVEELLGKSAPARLAHALVELGKRHGVEDDGGILIPLRLSQGELGKLVGLTRETINGILQVWKQQGIVEMDRRRLRLRDPARLERVR